MLPTQMFSQIDKTYRIFTILYANASLLDTP
jgi:hypothetical protein